jgi:tetraacyldisaccharide 4'-kinase
VSSNFAQRHWYRFSLLSAALYPLSLVFRAAVAARRALYACHVLPRVRLRVPVIVVGNVTVGGTGKTPLVLWLAEALLQAGRRPGVVCRSYRASRSEPGAVAAEGDPKEAGDEAVLLARRCGCPVWSGADRASTAQALLAARPECDLIVCDDGLQHYRLARDVEIAVEDERGYGNGLMLPAGPLREPASRPVDARVINLGSQAGHFSDAPRSVESGGTARGQAGNMFRMWLEPSDLYSVCDPAKSVDIEMLRDKAIHAVAGIGDPTRFFATLQGLELQFARHVFPDHYPFQARDLEFGDAGPVVMTEKDAVKCQCFGRDDLFALRVTAKPEPAFVEFIRNRLHGLKTA